MPKYTTGRSLSVRLAVVLLCSFAPFGCAQGLRPTLPKIWGPDRITVKNATRGMTRFVRREKKESAAAKSQQAAARSSDPGVDSRSGQGGVDVANTPPPADEKKSSMLSGLAAIVERRTDRERAVVDPFTAASEAAGDTPRQRPETTPPQQSSIPQYPAAVQNVLAGKIGTTAANNTPLRPEFNKNPFVEEFDSKLERLRASVGDEFEHVESPASQATRLSDARDHIGDLMQQARQSIADGRLSDAAATLESASDLTGRMGVFFGPDEEQPGDLFRRVRDHMQEQQAARAAEQRVAEQIERGADQRPVTNASNPFLPRAVVTEVVNRPEIKAQEERPQEQLAVADSSPDEPRGSHADTGQPPVNTFPSVRIYPRGLKPDDPNGNMIVDAASVPSRFSSRPLTPVEVIVPAGSDAESNAGDFSAPSPFRRIETGNDAHYGSAGGAQQAALRKRVDINASSRSSVPAIDPAMLGRLKQNDLLNFQK